MTLGECVGCKDCADVRLCGRSFVQTFVCADVHCADVSRSDVSLGGGVSVSLGAPAGVRLFPIFVMGL